MAVKKTEPFLHLNMAISVPCGCQGHTVAPRCPEEKSYRVAGPVDVVVIVGEAAVKLATFRQVFTVLPHLLSYALLFSSITPKWQSLSVLA